MKTDSIAFRLIAGAALWLGLALVVSGFVLAALFADHVERGFDRRASILLESLVAVAEVTPSGGLVIADPPGEPRFRQPYSGWYWQVDSAAGEVRRSPSLWDDTLPLSAAADGRPSRYEIDGPRGRRLRIVARRITLPGSDQVFRFAVAADAAELAAELRPFTITLALSLGARGSVFERLHRHEDATSSYAEGLRVITPSLLDLPQAFAPLSVWLLKGYLGGVEVAGMQADNELLGPVISKLQEIGAIELRRGGEIGEPSGDEEGDL